MFVVASSGLNLPLELLESCRIEETPHPIVVDGVHHDMRSITSFAVLRQLQKNAKVAPYPLGSSAPEYVALFNELVKRTSEVLVVTGTRKLLGSYGAAMAAVRVVTGTRQRFDARVLDTGFVELGAGIIAAYCGATACAGHGLNAVLDAGQTLAAASTQMFVASPRDARLSRDSADLLRTEFTQPTGSLPVVGMQDGEPRTFGSVAEYDQIAATLTELVAQRYATGSALWVTVTYADELTPARELLALLRKRFDIRYALSRPMGPAGYLVLGSRSIGVSVHPTAAMPLAVSLPTLP